MSVDRIKEIDVVKNIDEMLISQYKDSVNLKAYIKSLVSPIQPIINATHESILSRSIQLASGYSLDKIGTTVGEDRVIIGAAASPYFGFKDNPQALSFNVGTFFSYGDRESGDLVLSDPDYRSLIRARIIKNTKAGNVNDVIEYLKLLTEGSMLGEELKTNVNQRHLEVELHFDNVLSTQTKLLLSLKASQIISSGVRLTMRDNDGNIEVTQYGSKTKAQ